MCRKAQAIEGVIKPGSVILALGREDARVAHLLREQGKVCDVITLGSLMPSDMAFANPLTFPIADAVLCLGLLHDIIASTGRAAKGFLEALLHRFPLVFTDMGSFTETAESDWQRAYTRYWASDFELWNDMLGVASSKTPLAYAEMPGGGARLLWRLEGCRSQRTSLPIMTQPQTGPVAIVTDVDFWTRDAGHRVRIDAMITYFAQHHPLTVICLRPVPADQILDICGAYPNVDLVFLTEAEASRWPTTAARLTQVFAAGTFTHIIVHYAYLHWVTDLVPAETVKILDTHDLLAVRAHRFWMNDRPSPVEVTEEEEQRWFDKFDRIAFIQQEELNVAQRKLTAARCTLCPHPVVPRARAQRPAVRAIGFMASAALPNQDGLHWFCQEVLPLLDMDSVNIKVFGGITDRIQSDMRYEGIEYLGPIDDVEVFYDEIDIVFNPVRYGGGLKIKTVETLAYGRPLISTPAGVAGLYGLGDAVAAVCSKPQDFAEALTKMIQSPQSEREVYVRRGQRFVSDRLTADKCFASLLRG